MYTSITKHYCFTLLDECLVRLRAPLMEAFPTGPPTMTPPKGPQEQV